MRHRGAGGSRSPSSPAAERGRLARTRRRRRHLAASCTTTRHGPCPSWTGSSTCTTGPPYPSRTASKASPSTAGGQAGEAADVRGRTGRAHEPAWRGTLPSRGRCARQTRPCDSGGGYAGQSRARGARAHEQPRYRLQSRPRAGGQSVGGSTRTPQAAKAWHGAMATSGCARARWGSTGCQARRAAQRQGTASPICARDPPPMRGTTGP